MWGDIYPEWAGKYDYSWGMMPVINQAARHWVGTSQKGIHVFLLNADNQTGTLKFAFGDTPGLRGYKGKELLVHDMWTGEDIATFRDEVEIEVKRYDTASLKISTVDGKSYL